MTRNFIENQDQAILGNVSQNYILSWSQFSTSRIFPEICNEARNLSENTSLESILAILLHKDDLGGIDSFILKEIISDFNVAVDASNLAVLVRRGIKTGLRETCYLIDASREFEALANNKMLRDRDIEVSNQAEEYRNNSNIRQVFYTGDNISLTVTKHGQMLYVDTLDTSLSPHLLVSGDWEPGITRFFRSRIKEGMRYLEIGANCGWFTIQAAALVGQSGRVVAFEPNKRYTDLIRRNLTINGLDGHSKVVEKAVCDENKEMNFSIFQTYRGNSTLLQADVVAEKFSDEFDVVKVSGVTLDTYFPAGETFDFLKIDAESAETLILDGGTRFFQENQKAEIIVEASPLGEKDDVKRHIAEILTDMGYTCLRIDDEGYLKSDGLHRSGIDIFATKNVDGI